MSQHCHSAAKKKANVALACVTVSNPSALSSASKTLAGIHCPDLSTRLLGYYESTGKYPEKSNRDDRSCRKYLLQRKTEGEEETNKTATTNQNNAQISFSNTYN